MSNGISRSNSAQKESITLSLAIHNHQPVGNFDFVFEQAYKQAYEPMVAALERHPGVRIALHYSGPLRDWLLANRPQLIERVHALVARGQVEIMSGGYYEPILIALPDADKQGQIRKLSLAVQDDFDFVPSGAWLAERIWEPHLARDLQAAGIDYTIVDDTHFTSAGLNEEQLFGYYVTEEQGHTLKIFATSRTLRYIIPWEQPDQVLEWLRGQADSTGNRVAVMGDDGEKFGLWPGTYEQCWGSEQWIERFFSLLEAGGDWIRTVPPGECARRFPPLGRVYLPTASYEEMMEWALPAGLARSMLEVKHRLQGEGRAETLRFVRGGFWRNFMVKYPEVNTMHKKMLRVSEKIQQLRRDHGGEDPRIQQALEHLWAGQCNCSYWHGVFGGIYLFHIRAATFEHLIKAESLIDSLKHGEGAWVDVAVTDFDKDGREEVLLESDCQNLYFHPAEGGQCFEWDWRQRAFNLLNTLGRYREGYHQALREASERGDVVISGRQQRLENIHGSMVRVKAPDLHEKLIYDRQRRGSFIDHVFTGQVSLEEFRLGNYTEAGDFSNGQYRGEIRESGAGEGGNVGLTLSREGRVSADGDCADAWGLIVEKSFELRAGEPGLELTYTLQNTSNSSRSFTFGVETNWALLGGSGPDVFLQARGDAERVPAMAAAELESVDSARLVVNWLNMEIGLALSKEARFLWFPIETVSNSEAGFESIYQGSCLVWLWPLKLAPGSSWDVQIGVELRSVRIGG